MLFTGVQTTYKIKYFSPNNNFSYKTKTKKKLVYIVTLFNLIVFFISIY